MLNYPITGFFGNTQVLEVFLGERFNLGFIRKLAFENLFLLLFLF
jgi:hypothetical protein